MTNYKKPARLTSRFIRLLGDLIAPSGIGAGRLCIVNYHRILESFDPLLESEPDLKTFRWQMELLAECFNVMPLHDALQALSTQRLPPRVVCITFDDGYRSTHDLALPILKELNLPATVFVTTGYVDEGNMWNDKILEAVRRLPDGQLDLRDVGLGIHSIQTLADRKYAIHKLTEDAKYLPPTERLNLTSKLEELAGDGLDDGLMLTSEMIRTLAQQGIEIGAHTISHPILTSLEDKNARYEIEGGKRQLEAITGSPVRLFAYPNGKVGMDFDERHVAMAKEAGFAAAFTTAFGAATKANDLYQIPRSRPWDSTPFFYALRLLRWLAH
jgi:peptidoglycan/xylan/chitin deacetylase (PgdA/CDA1 family)